MAPIDADLRCPVNMARATRAIWELRGDITAADKAALEDLLSHLLNGIKFRGLLSHIEAFCR